MSVKMNWIACLTVALLLSWLAPCVAADEALDKAFDALKSYDWGADRNQLKPIDDAVVASHKDAAAQKDLQAKLVAVLESDAKRAGKDYVCRKLSLIGTADAVPALAKLLPEKELSHMGRYALERMPCAEAVAAMRGALGKTSGRTKVGVINSLGVRRDAESTKALVGLLGDSDKEIAGAAAAALGAVGTPDAAKALASFQTKAPKGLKPVAADAYLTCAEKLLADGNKAQAVLIYQALSKSQVKHVRVAAMCGMLAAAKAK